MKLEWREVSLGELVDGGSAEIRTGPFGTQLRASDYSESGVPVINVRNLGYGSVRDAQIERVDLSVQLRLAQHLLACGDIVFGRKGAVDRHVLVSERQHGWMQGSDCIRLRVTNRSEIDPAFLSAYFSTDVHKRWMDRQCSHGATMASLNQGVLRRISLQLPPPSVQQRISGVKRALDELIDNNERRIAVLEDLARSLYREWFVELRFPGHTGAKFGDDGLPEGWRRVAASAVFAVNPRRRATQARYRKITMGDVDERAAAAFPSSEVERATGSRFKNGDTLMARITPCLENGKTALVQCLGDDEVACGSTEFIVLSGVRVGRAFTYLSARSDRMRDAAIKSMTGASGRQRVDVECFNSLFIAEPCAAIARAFEDVAGPMLAESFALTTQNQCIAATRDHLLPRLVTGQLDISDIDLGALTPEALPT